MEARVDDPAAFNEASLQLPPELSSSAPAVHIPKDKEVVWRVVAEREGQYDIQIAAAGQTVSKQVVVSPGLARVSPVRLKDNFWERMFASGEPALADNSPVQSIAINYPPRDDQLRLDGVELDCPVLCGVADCRFHFQECAGNSGMKLRSIAANKRFGLVPTALLIVALVLLFPLRSEAYAGPGAGFAVLSSFWTIFVAFLYSFYALVTWPIRQLLRLFRRRKAYGKAQVKRVVIVGLRWHGSRTRQPLHGRRQAAEPDQAARQRNFSSAANDISRDLSGGVVHVSDRSESGQTQYL